MRVNILRTFGTPFLPFSVFRSFGVVYFQIYLGFRASKEKKGIHGRQLEDIL